MAKYQEPKPVKNQHSFTKQIMHWRYCAKCGLVLLKNDASLRASRKACDDGE